MGVFRIIWLVLTLVCVLNLVVFLYFCRVGYCCLGICDLSITCNGVVLFGLVCLLLLFIVVCWGFVVLCDFAVL